MGGTDACAILQSGLFACWHMLGSIVSVQTRSDVANAESISMGYGHVCMVRTDHALVCWGLHTTGQLGTSAGNFTNQLQGAMSVSGISATMVSAGYDNTCAVLMNSTVSCCDEDGAGQLGNGQRLPGANPVRRLVASLAPVTEVSAWIESTCARSKSSTILCWGSTDQGKLGDGSLPPATPYSLVPRTVKGLSNAISVSAGVSYACTFTFDHGIQCWGEGNGGKLTIGSLNSSPTRIVRRLPFLSVKINA